MWIVPLWFWWLLWMCLSPCVTFGNDEKTLRILLNVINLTMEVSIFEIGCQTKKWTCWLLTRIFATNVSHATVSLSRTEWLGTISTASFQKPMNLYRLQRQRDPPASVTAQSMEPSTDTTGVTSTTPCPSSSPESSFNGRDTQWTNSPLPPRSWTGRCLLDSDSQTREWWARWTRRQVLPAPVILAVLCSKSSTCLKAFIDEDVPISRIDLSVPSPLLLLTARHFISHSPPGVDAWKVKPFLWGSGESWTLVWINYQFI
jgi:hypothetical protein